MANAARKGNESSLIIDRHGARGEVQLTVGVHPRIKDAIVDRATLEGVTVKSVVVDALEKHLGLA